ncbi:MAG TPA: methyltransferase domain-containing protein [Actinomycetota bacterium]
MADEHLAREQAFFDASSEAQFEAEPPPPTEHMAFLLRRLGSATGLRILDCGCGAGDLANRIAPEAGHVVGFDLSPSSVRLMRARAARAHIAPPDGIVSVMERLPLDDGCFDAVVGASILHHVDVEAALREVKRLMKPGGRAIFIENQVTNPLLRLAREKLTGRFGVARLGTIDEHPLVARDYAAIRRLFSSVTLHYPDFRFFGLISRNVLRYRRALWLARFFAWLDRAIYRWAPPLRRFGYHVIVEVRS